MIEKDYIKDLFQDKLTSHEVPVRADMWTSISSSIGTTSSVVASGITITTKIFIALGVASATVIGIYLLSEKEQTKPEIPKKQELPKNTEDAQQLIIDDEKEKSEKIILLNTEKSQVQQKDAITIQSNEELTTQENHLIEAKQENGLEKINNTENTKIQNNQNNSPPKSEESTEQQNDSENKIETKVILPNIFTPNGDGKNDFLSIKIDEVSEFSVVILNQANKVIFTSNDPNFSWDGIATNGELSPAGTYVYYISAKDLNGKLLTKYSNLTISY